MNDERRDVKYVYIYLKMIGHCVLNRILNTAHTVYVATRTRGRAKKLCM